MHDSQLQKLPDTLYTARQVRELDRIAIQEHQLSGLLLMKRAAQTCVDSLLHHWRGTSRVAVFCGSGNNAGDGYFIAAFLAEKHVQVTIVQVGSLEKLSSDARQGYEACCQQDIEIIADPRQAKLNQVEVIVDALLGTGVAGEIRLPFAEAINVINSLPSRVLSVDIPSGISADTGQVLGVAVRADVTVSFIGMKRGLMTLDGPDYVGEMQFDSLGVPEDIFTKVGKSVVRLSYPDLIVDFPKRRGNSHKNSFGNLLLVGGDQGMSGAILMSAVAAMRAGAGVVTVATHPAHAAFLGTIHPELMVRGITDAAALDSLIDKASCMVIGPGLGQSEWSERLFSRAIQAELPMVIDADGLTWLSRLPIEFCANNNWILTPHPGEATRLLQGAVEHSESYESANLPNVQFDRFSSVVEIQQRYGGNILLKGQGTLICNSDDVFLCPYGNPGMATAGMGDVLSGVIGGLVTQGCSLIQATTLGAVVHSKAADSCATRFGQRGLMATDLYPEIRRLVNGN
jgi:hydroxyethylthiazole kinase-like uncharacterized protein yjeF